ARPFGLRGKCRHAALRDLARDDPCLRPAPCLAILAAATRLATKREQTLCTVFEWYDFYLYGSLSAIIAAQFFSGVNPTAAFIFALMAFAAGFAVRPFGAIVFGRLGDLVGRK